LALGVKSVFDILTTFHESFPTTAARVIVIGCKMLLKLYRNRPTE